MRTKEKYEIYRPKKFLGQNFLVDDNISRKIIAQLDIKEGDNVIEIGPGQGALTKILISTTENFVAVEIDKHIIESLKVKYGDKLKLIHKDFLKIDFDSDLKNCFNNKNNIKVVGNLPYNITTEILFKLFEVKDIFECAVIMVQRELAKRLIAKPNSKDYGILAIQTQLNSNPEILFSVPPTAFFPKPRVYSSIIRLNFNKDAKNISDNELLKRIVRTAFGKRRKIMSNSLKEFMIEMNINPGDINFDFTRRPENVSVKEFVDLSNEILLHSQS